MPPVATHAADRPAPLLRVRPQLAPVRMAAPARRRDLFEGRWSGVLGTGADAAVLAAVLLLTAAQSGGGAEPAGRPALFALLAGATMVRLGSRGMYGTRPGRMSTLDILRQVLSAAGFATTLALAAAALIGAGHTAVMDLLAFGASAAAGIAAVRLALAAVRRRARLRGRSGRRAVIVGAGQIGLQLEARLRTMPELGLEPVGFLDADPSPAYWEALDASPVLGTPDELARVAEETGAGHVIVAFSSAPDSTVGPLIRRCEELGLEVSVVPRLFENVSDRQWVEHVGGLPLCGLHRVDPRSWEFTLKHAFDRAVAAGLLLVLAPLLAGLAAAVRMSSPGPILYRQRRVGRDGQEFDILKFRSMRMASGDAPQSEPGDSDTAPGGVEGEDRRTRAGALMRRTSLDELPQLVNVLLGHMSLVGPRPERPEFVDRFGETVRRYDDRHRVRSGMTGWAQVHGLRGQTSLAERIEWDNWYIQNWSLWLDLKILVMTPRACLDAPVEDRPPAAPVPALAVAA